MRFTNVIIPSMSNTRDAGTHHLIGGALCLDFSNTLYGHDAPIHEYLFDYRDLVLWSRHAEILTEAEAGILLFKWEQAPTESEAVFQSAIQLREAIHRAFVSLAHGKSPEEKDIIRIHRAWQEGLAHTRLVEEGTGFRLGWEEETALDRMLWPVARSAVELLTSDEVRRVKQCGRCDWVFLDRSRNRRRRWCSMDACGNRVKMSRRYLRAKGEADSNHP
jgi:predicted RNA-binding Zn ribbon-like protein